MNFRDLEYIIELSKTLNFSQAARNCNVSQPSLSAQIKKLETTFGTDIFYRDKRTVSLTTYGETFIQKSKEILAIRAELEKLSKSNQDPLEGTLKLGGILTIAPYMFPQIVHALEKEAPKVKPVLKEAKTEDLLKLLLDNKIDAALVSLPTDHHVFESRFLFSEPLYLSVPKKHPLSKYKMISDGDLKTEKLILLEEGHCFRSQALDVCHSTSAKENKIFSATSLETIREFISNGNGMTLMPEMARKRNDNIHYIPMKNGKFSRDVGIIWKKSSKKQAQIEKLISVITNEVVKTPKR